MRGARRLGALFMCVGSLVISRAVALKELNQESTQEEMIREMLSGDVLEREYVLQENAVVAKSFLAALKAFGAAHTQTARVRQELDAVRAARKGDAVDGSKLERGPIVLDKADDGDEKTIDSID